MKNILSAVMLLLCLTFSVNAQEKHTTVNEQEKPTCQMHKKGRSKGNKKDNSKDGKDGHAQQTKNCKAGNKTGSQEHKMRCDAPQEAAKKCCSPNKPGSQS